MKFIKCLTRTLVIFSFLASPYLQATPVGSDGNTADYIVVGVGTAGAVMAKRLSDDKKTSVIALHSGDNLSSNPIIKYSRNVLITVPTGLLGTFNPATSGLTPEELSELAVFFQLADEFKALLYETGLTTPQPNADDRELLWATGFPAGGASSINAGAYCRGTNQMYSQWEPLAGPEWSVKRIIRTFRELEHYYGKTNNPNVRGFNGPLIVRQIPHPIEVSKKFAQAVINATGFPFVLDYNDPNTPIGASTNFQLTQKGKSGIYRVSSATAFLNKHVMKSDGVGADGRRLHVFFNTNALKVVWEGNKAVGVQYLQNGVIKTAFANKGVVVCAGLRSSPFLMYSGVGPAGLLNSLGIPIVYDNPNVGQGLADQPQILMVFASNPDDTPSGQFTAFSQISWLPAPGGDPTIRQIRLSAAGVVPGATLALLDLIQAKSRGSVSINSANPLAPPVVDLGELSNPDDLELYKSALKIYVKNINLALHEIDPEYELLYPDPAILDDDVLLTEFIKFQVASNQSFQCHCRMAPLAQGGVVDGTGHVYGVQNLIIADDSILPVPMDGSTMSTAYLVAMNIARILGH